MAVPVLIGAAAMNQDVLVDSLVADVIDGLREELHPQFGVRAYRLYHLIRTWTGRDVGEGQFSDVAHEIRPQPRVQMWNGLRYVQADCGIREIGDVQLTEVSLTYTSEQLEPRNLRRNQAFYFVLGDAHGQETPLKVWAHTRPPFIDRERDMGWSLALRRVDGAPDWRPT